MRDTIEIHRVRHTMNRSRAVVGVAMEWVGVCLGVWLVVFLMSRAVMPPSWWPHVYASGAGLMAFCIAYKHRHDPKLFYIVVNSLRTSDNYDAGKRSGVTYVCEER